MKGSSRMNILIVAAHPDDEILGVGGTIARHIEAGDEVCVLILGEGQTSRCEKRERAEAGIVEQLHKNTLAAADVLGIKEVFLKILLITDLTEKICWIS